MSKWRNSVMHVNSQNNTTKSKPLLTFHLLKAPRRCYAFMRAEDNSPTNLNLVLMLHDLRNACPTLDTKNGYIHLHDTV
ncbi:unnamed protein product [Mesocestoides corti]|uniref:Uncharacterized protein n=1 Tax=Mesocestoides corti TaxID=53468 RepID=A0A0R3UG25_MESCO|nr:unnamed protein product [Mesocestoides corti]